MKLQNHRNLKTYIQIFGYTGNLTRIIIILSWHKHYFQTWHLYLHQQNIESCKEIFRWPTLRQSLLQLSLMSLDVRLGLLYQLQLSSHTPWLVLDVRQHFLVETNVLHYLFVRTGGGCSTFQLFHGDSGAVKTRVWRLEIFFFFQQFLKVFIYFTTGVTTSQHGKYFVTIGITWCVSVSVL